MKLSLQINTDIFFNFYFTLLCMLSQSKPSLQRAFKTTTVNDGKNDLTIIKTAGVNHNKIILISL